MIRKTLLTTLFILLASTAASSQWVQQTTGNGFDFFSCSFPSVNTGFVCGYGNRLIKTTNGGTNWLDISFEGTANNLNAIFFVNETTGWLCKDDTLLFTINCAESWNAYPVSIYGRKIFFINPNTGWITAFQKIYKTTNGGLNWDFSATPTDGPIFFVNALTGWTSYSAGGNCSISRTTDGGNTWNPQFSTADFHYIYAFDFVNETTGWATGYRETVLKTTNGGLNWVFQRDIAESNGLYSVDFVNENTGWAAGDLTTGGSKVLSTTNGGLNWNQSVVPGGRLAEVEFVNSSTGWIVGQFGKVFKTTNTGGITAVSTSNNSLPEKFSLFQNYPNPFNPETNIKFQLSKSANVRLTVFDILGREAGALVNEKLSEGTYEVSWNASNLPSGIYFYTLQAGDFSETKKMILQK